MDILEIKSPAKINFGLNVIRKRDDGYHDIETIFYPINLFDNIYLKKSNKFSFDSNIEFLKTDPSNLVLKAKEKIELLVGREINVEIQLNKIIPIGAGMGGGSSNCAAVLSGLNQLFDLNIPYKDLFKIASELGSDISFFLKPVPSFAYSKGEKIEEISFSIPHPILIINPGIHIQTKWAYEHITPMQRNFSLQNIDQHILNNKIELYEKVVNDFEEIIFGKYPEIAEIKSKLYYFGAHFALMTGSGSSLFALFNDLDSAKKAEEFFTPNYFTFIHYEKS